MSFTAVAISRPFHCVSTPRVLRILTWVWISRSSGMLAKVQESLVIRLTARIGRALFFEPATLIEPERR